MLQKPRKYRGEKSKSHQWETPSQRVEVPTDMTPINYRNVIDSVELKEGQQLPAGGVMHNWTETNGQSNFSKRVVMDVEVTETMKFMKSSNQKIMQENPPQESQAQSSGDWNQPPNASSRMVQQTTVEELTVTMSAVKLNNFPPNYKTVQG